MPRVIVLCDRLEGKSLPDKAKIFPTYDFDWGGYNGADLDPKYYEGQSMDSGRHVAKDTVIWSGLFSAMGLAEKGKGDIFLTGNDILETCVEHEDYRKRIDDLAVFKSMSEED